MKRINYQIFEKSGNFETFNQFNIGYGLGKSPNLLSWVMIGNYLIVARYGVNKRTLRSILEKYILKQRGKK